jgi:hypothetical protein
MSESYDSAFEILLRILEVPASKSTWTAIILNDYFRRFSHFLQEMVGQLCKISHDHFHDCAIYVTFSTN